MLGLPTYWESRFDRFRPIAKGGWRESVNPETEGGGMLWDLGSHLVDQVVSLFGAPETVFGTLRNQRGQGPDDVEDDWLAILTYPPSHPLPGDAFAPGTKLGGLRIVLGATCLSTHIDAEQPRFRVEGTHGSFVKKGTDPQETQLKLGWTPRSHPDTFGIYDEKAPASLRLARLTTSPAGQEASASNQPKVMASDIPILPGRYIDLYINLADTIRMVATSTPEAAAEAIHKHLSVKLEHVSASTRVLRLIRESAKEGRFVSYETS